MKLGKKIYKYIITEIPDDMESQLISDFLEIFGDDIDESMTFEKFPNYESVYCILDPINQFKFLNAFKKIGVLVDYIDLTQDIIEGKYNFTQKSPEFQKIFDNFIKDNLNIDYVLDKISNCGISNLNKTEELFLNNYGKGNSL